LRFWQASQQLTRNSFQAFTQPSNFIMDGINPYNGNGNPANGANGDGYGGTPVTGGMPAFPGGNGPEMPGSGPPSGGPNDINKTTLWYDIHRHHWTLRFLTKT
jgi:hypothetical protein